MHSHLNFNTAERSVQCERVQFCTWSHFDSRFSIIAVWECSVGVLGGQSADDTEWQNEWILMLFEQEQKPQSAYSSKCCWCMLESRSVVPLVHFTIPTSCSVPPQSLYQPTMEGKKAFPVWLPTAASVWGGDDGIAHVVSDLKRTHCVF